MSRLPPGAADTMLEIVSLALVLALVSLRTFDAVKGTE